MVFGIVSILSNTANSHPQKEPRCADLLIQGIAFQLAVWRKDFQSIDALMHYEV